MVSKGVFCFLFGLENFCFAFLSDRDSWGHCDTPNLLVFKRKLKDALGEKNNKILAIFLICFYIYFVTCFLFIFWSYSYGQHS